MPTARTIGPGRERAGRAPLRRVLLTTGATGTTGAGATAAWRAGAAGAVRIAAAARVEVAGSTRESASPGAGAPLDTAMEGSLARPVVEVTPAGIADPPRVAAGRASRPDPPRPDPSARTRRGQSTWPASRQTRRCWTSDRGPGGCEAAHRLALSGRRCSARLTWRLPGSAPASPPFSADRSAGGSGITRSGQTTPTNGSAPTRQRLRRSRPRVLQSAAGPRLPAHDGGSLVPFARCRDLRASARLPPRGGFQDRRRPFRPHRQRSSDQRHGHPAADRTARARGLSPRRSSDPPLHVPAAHRDRRRSRADVRGRVPLPGAPGPLPLGDLEAATPICNACTAAHIFRPDEDETRPLRQGPATTAARSARRTPGPVRFRDRSASEATCKPSSVPRSLAGTVIHLDRRSPGGSCGRPEGWAAHLSPVDTLRRRRVAPSYLALLRVEFAAFHPGGRSRRTRLCGTGPRLAADGRYPLPCAEELGLSSSRVGEPTSARDRPVASLAG